MESEEMRRIMREEFEIFKKDIIGPMKTDTDHNTQKLDKLVDCTIRMKENISSLGADSQWHTWAIRVLYGSVITEGIAIIALMLA